MAGTLCLSGAMLLKAGKNVSSDISVSDTKCNSFINEAECYVIGATKTNWIDTYATLNADKKLILQEAVSNLAGIYAISYDMSGFTSRAEAELMISVLYRRAMDCLKVLSVNFVGSA